MALADTSLLMEKFIRGHIKMAIDMENQVFYNCKMAHAIKETLRKILKQGQGP